MAQTAEQYEEGRQRSTEAGIEQCFGDKGKLMNLLGSREELARIYAEDGTRHTAHLIEVIDIALIRRAINSAAE